jgi:hypothetical protein
VADHPLEIGRRDLAQASPVETFAVPWVHDGYVEVDQALHRIPVLPNVGTHAVVDEDVVVDDVARERAPASSNSPMLAGVWPGRCGTASISIGEVIAKSSAVMPSSSTSVRPNEVRNTRQRRMYCCRSRAPAAPANDSTAWPVAPDALQSVARWNPERRP